MEQMCLMKELCENSMGRRVRRRWRKSSRAFWAFDIKCMPDMYSCMNDID
jgi:hypothetical protein